MSEGLISTAVTSALHEALRKAQTDGQLRLEVWPSLVFDIPKRAEWGDLSTTVAMGLAKGEKRSPREIADVIASHLQGDTDLFDHVDVVPPGYINLTLKRDQWFRVLTEIERQGASYGASRVHEDQKILIEFVSANPTGPLHVGHGRGAAVGDALARLLSLTGAEVSREYYVNDVGTQIETLGKSVLMRVQQQDAGDHDQNAALPEGLYQGQYISAIAAAFMESHPSGARTPGEGDAVEIGRFAKDIIFHDIREDLRMFNINFDEVFEEHTLYDDGVVQGALDALRAKEYVYTADDADWLATSRWGDDKDRVVKRANGQYTYFASDIAYHMHKFNRGFQRLINVWGADHHGYVPRMIAMIHALGYSEDRFQVSLVQLVSLVRSGKPVAMSTRAGEFVTLREVMDEVGVDAARFFFLMRRSDTPLDFDLDLAKRNSNENPVFYVQYAHARIASLFKMAREQGMDCPSVSEVTLTELGLPEELALIKKLAEYPEIISESARSLEPHRVAYYLQELAASLHSYYYKHRILQADAPELTSARLVLMRAVQTVVRNGLAVLGVSAPEAM
ncbi:MAG TPA: arginine--tRNA ligase [Nitrospirales bacterium]|nr:arginine--tRNA ligase [Nitrospirales bacterium]